MKSSLDYERLIAFEQTVFHYAILLLAILIGLIFQHISTKFGIYVLICISMIIIRNAFLGYFNKLSKLDEERKSWLFLQIKKLLKKYGHLNISTIYQVKSILDQLDSFDYKIELIPDNNPQQGVFSIPDIAFAEKELIEMEQRISRSLVVLVCAPILFSIYHFVYSLDLSILIINALCLFTIVEIITHDMRNPYKLDGWGECLDDLYQHSFSFSKDPFGTLIQFENYFKNIYAIELNLKPSLKSFLPAYKTIGILLTVILEIDPLISHEMIVEFLKSTNDLPKVEDIHKKKWRAYSSQFIFITTSIVFFSAILGSLFKIIGMVTNQLRMQSPNNIVQFVKPSEYTADITMIFMIIVIYSLSAPFMSLKKRKLMISFWVLEYMLIMYLVYFVFEALMVGIIN
ncbi:MAG: hypothetical protein ACXAD7_04415 [Candidatus Kariarchaeaceae archaeon]|jgi:hypothetical protein